MDSNTRKANLIRIQSVPENVVMTGIPLNYQGMLRHENVYRIPLEYLVYNKYNGRIGTEVKSFEKQNYVLNAELDCDKAIIEGFLYSSKEDRNEKTMKSLLEQTQQRYGIVTADGVVIDGNRRAMLLNTLFRERQQRRLAFQDVEHCQYFLAVILPAEAGEKDIQQLETIYQMGEDAKLDYNPIEKYLKCADLRRVGFTNKDIAEFMGEKESKVAEMISILKLMEDYLDTYGYQGIYTRLEKTEGPFVDLNGYLNAYLLRSNNARTDWNYDDSDVSELKSICFDYIRARYEGKEFRDIAKTGRDGYSSIFSCKDVWTTFKDRHETEVGLIEEPTVEEIRREQPGEDLTKLLRNRDVEWTARAEGVLKNSLKQHTARLEDRRDSNQPAKLLEKAFSILDAVDTDQSSFCHDPAVKTYVVKINKLTYEMKKLLE